MYKQYLFFFLEADGRSLTVQNGVVTPSADPVALKYTADGWREISIAWDRDMKTGVVRQVSTPFGFIKEDAMVLRKAFYLESLNREIFLYIARLDLQIDLVGQTFKPVYKKMYRGLLDSTTFKNSRHKIEAALSEGGLWKKYNQNKDTVYEYLLSEGDADVKLDGINLRQTHNFLVPASNFFKDNHFLDVAFINKEGDGAGVATFTQFGGRIAGTYDYLESTRYFLATTQAITGIRLKGQVKFVAQQGQSSYTLYLWRTSINAAQNIQELFGLNAGQEYTIDVDVTLNAEPGERFFLNAQVNYQNIVKLPVNYLETTLTLSVVSKYGATYCPSYTPFRLFQRLCKSVFGSEGVAISTLLPQFAELKITSGDGLRSIEKAKIKTSLKDFIEFCFVIMGASFGIESRGVVIEDRSYAFTTVSPIHLGSVKNVETSEATDLLFTDIEVGYNGIDTDDVNGKFAFNTRHQYKVSVPLSEPKKLTLISPYEADPYGIELTRINLTGRTTTDDSSDNKVFVLNAVNKIITRTVDATVFGLGNFLNIPTINTAEFIPGHLLMISGAGALNGTYTIIVANPDTTGGGLVRVKEPVVAGNYPGAVITLSFAELNRTAVNVTGVPDADTIFNIPLLTPKQILRRHLIYINSCLHKEAGSKITFQTSDKNDALTYTLGGDAYVEKGDETIGTTRLFLGVYITFDSPGGMDIAALMETRPNTPFSLNIQIRNTTQFFTVTGITKRAAIAPTDEKEQSFKLIAGPDSDFKQLIHA